MSKAKPQAKSQNLYYDTYLMLVDTGAITVNQKNGSLVPIDHRIYWKRK